MNVKLFEAFERRQNVKQIFVADGLRSSDELQPNDVGKHFDEVDEDRQIFKREVPVERQVSDGPVGEVLAVKD